MKRFYPLAACLVFAPFAVRADASNFCLWSILVEAHAIAARCGKTLNAPAEQRYRQLREAADAEIIRDASLSPGMSPEKAKAGMASYVARTANGGPDVAAYCAKEGVRTAVTMLEGMTTVENTAKFLSGLAVRKNPFEGECL